MDFGRIPENELDTTDLKLKKDPAFNSKILKGKPVAKPKIYVGCAKWGRKEWVGKIYPEKTKEANFLEHYVAHYNSIEMNATHYKLYDGTTIRKWADKAKDKDFLFCPKVYQGISHFGKLNEKQILTDQFLAGITEFGEHLGPVFFQVSDRFSPNRKDELFAYLATLPSDVQFFVEVRHPDWFKPEHAEDLFNTLAKLKLGAVITDTAGRRDCAHMYLTVPKTFIRYVGNSLHKTDYTRIDEWVKRSKQWLDSGLKELYFFMHMHDEATSPELTVYLADQLKKLAGIDIIRPKFIAGEPKLF
jgi:uncharacterized protein YecE (DUF72 family)